MKPKALKRGDTIGVVSTSEPITDECREDIEKSVKRINDLGLNVKFAKHAFNNPLGYGETAKHKAEDINEMFRDKSINAIFCTMGGFNCNAVFDYLDFEIIKNNPKIICGYSDPTSILNVIYAKTGLVTFHGPNFKSLSDEEVEYGYKEVIKRFIDRKLSFGENDEYKVVNEGTAEGILVRRKFELVFKFNYRKIHGRCTG